MAFLTSSVVLLSVLVTSFVASTTVTPPSHDVELISTTNAIHEDFTKSLTITCSFLRRPGTDFMMVTSLMLSKSDTLNSTSYQQIASLTAMDGDHVIIADPLGAEVSGRLTTTGDSVLTFHWLYPSNNVEGRYMCKVNGINMVGHPISATASTAISQKPVDIPMVLSKIKTMDVIQDNAIDFMTDVATELQRINGKMNETREAFAQAIGTFRGHQYLLSRPTQWNVPVADVTCRTLGGYLVEINDEEELQFVAGMLDDVNWTKHTLYGATDYEHQQHWTYFSTGKTAFLKWLPGRPTNAGNYDCLFGEKSSDWLMIDYHCVQNLSVVFACEIQ